MTRFPTMAVAALLLAVAVAAMAAEQTDAERRAQQQVAEASNAFTADLYKALRAQQGNLVVSPLSAAAVLALALQGAGGRTAQQMKTVLRLPDDDAATRLGFRQLFASLQTNDEAIVRIANKVYSRRGSAIKEPFRRTAVDDFHAGAEELDFQGDTENARRAINAWVEETTSGKIKDLLKDLDPATLLVLVNAIYFKGTWAKRFEVEDTYNETFHVTPTTEVQVPMMHRTAQFGHARLRDLGAHVLELPYRGHTMRMLVVLPDAVDGLARVEEGLPSLNLTKLSREMSYGEVIVTLPKFKIEETFQLHETLPQMGMTDLFVPGANLTGITDADVVVSKVVQKAFVEVTEEGTVAAAATALVAVAASASFSPREPVVFKADRPFLYMIVTSGDTILFLGRTQHPQFQ